MNPNMFRQTSLARLSSPEQLDQLLKITTARNWLGLLALFMLLAVAAIWGFAGSIATTASGQGVIIRNGGVLNVVGRGSGMITKLNVAVGDRIQANQVVATISQPLLTEKMKALQATLAEAGAERERNLHIKQNAVRLQVEALERQISNNERQISELDGMAKLATEDIASEDQLLNKGLVTRQQTVAARQKLTGIQDQIAGLHAQNKQLEAQQFSLQSQPQQEDADMKAHLSSLQRQLDQAKQEMTMAETVVSPYAGEVLELKAYAGSMVTEGQPILSIQPEAQELQLLTYLPASQAKDAHIGMEAQVSPSTIKREEFGFMKGQIVYVADYPATPAAVMSNFQNESLVTALTNSGPVTELRIALNRNDKTRSGFEWSTSDGPPVMISSGTMCNVEVVTRRQPPISLLVPYMKKKFGIN